jgi:TonB-linked SusC/RagA family outer membrane protein
MKKARNDLWLLKPEWKFYRLSLTLKIAVLLMVCGFALPSYSFASGSLASNEQQQINVTGKITDAATGEPMPGVNIMVKGTLVGAIADVQGKYSISVTDRNATLVFSYIGYVSQEIPLAGKTTADVVLTAQATQLEEVVVVGYGSTTKKVTTASVSTISPDHLKLPVPTLGDELAGKANGVFVMSSGGGPGKKPTITIRGGSTPLVVIDGIVSTITDLQNLNPNDIENFSVLKDAEGAAIYGARAGNGIIAITTKRGTTGAMKINYDFTYNLTQPTILPQKFGSYDRVTIANQARANDGQAPAYAADVVQKYKDQSDPFNYPNTDWQKVCLNTFAPSVRHNLAIDGGNDKSRYYASISYLDQGTLYKFNTNWLKRYNFKLSLTNKFEKIGLVANVNLFGTVEEVRIPSCQYGSGYYYTWGHIQNSGPTELAYTDLGLFSQKGDHPLVEISPNSGYNLTQSRNINGIIDLAWSVPWIKGLQVKAINQYRLNNNWQKTWNATANQYPLGSTVPIVHTAPQLYALSGQGYSYTNQLYGEYNRTFAKDHTVDALFGFERSFGYDESVNATRIGYTLIFDQFIAGPAINSTNGGTAAESARAGYIGRLKYSYKTKYFAEGSFRRDGSDWFPPDKRWGTFWSGSAGWIISSEEFMNDLNDRNIINFLKFRASYGIVGLDGADAGISRFQYLAGYSVNQTGYLINNAFVPIFTEGPLVSPDLTWYTQKSRNIGLDFASLKSKLYGSFDYFFMETTGMLASLSGSLYTDPLGTSLPTRKSNGNLRRGGFEISLGYKNNIGDLTYDISGNISRFLQMWKVNPNEDQSTLKNPYTRTTYQTDYYGIGYHSLGYYTSADDVLNSPKLVASTNLVPGDIKYEDTNGDGRIDASDQRRIGEDATPRVIYGVNLDLQYKGWFLSTLVQGSGNRNLYPGDVVQQGQTYTFQSDYWTPTNTGAIYPRLMSAQSYNGSNNIATSDFWLVSGRYIRLKSLQIGYDFKTLAKNLPFLSQCSIILSGSNLITMSQSLRRYKMDPEVGSNNNYDYPPDRAYSFTLRIGF